MLLRRAVVAAGLAVAVASIGAGTAFAGTSGESAGAGVLASAPLQQQDESALLEEQGLCADGSVEGDAGACESENLNNGYVNACVRGEGGLVSDIAGGEGGVAQQAGLACADVSGDTEPVPPPEGGGDNGGGSDSDEDGDGPTATPPLNRAEPAEPADAIEAEPTFTG